MPVNIGRRELIAALGSAAAWPFTARAQQPAMPVIGVLNPESPDPSDDRLPAFRQGLSETGYVEGRNVAIKYLWAEGHDDRLSALVADLIHSRVAVIFSSGMPGALIGRRQPRRFRSCSRAVLIPSDPASSPVSLGQGAT
jgi:putative ABC transport system substrate-binding protein